MAPDRPDDSVPRQRAPLDPLGVLGDDALVEAARTGRLRDDLDPVAQVLERLRRCATGSCTCPSRDRCVVQDAGR